MSRSLNRAQLIGNLGDDPQVRYLPNGQAVANWSVATTSSWKDHNTGEKQERTEWHRCQGWGKLAEIVGQYLHKGDKVFVEGEIRTRKWQDQSGQDRYTTEIVVGNLVMLGSPAGAGGVTDGGGRGGGAAPTGGAPPFDDDIPF